MAVEPPETPAQPLTRLRPGHADLAGALKYGFKDVRQVLERASARETATRVAVGAVARRLLAEFGVEVRSHTVVIGGVCAQPQGRVDWERVEASAVRTADAAAEEAMVAAITGAAQAGDTLGGVFEIIVEGLPAGLGSHVHWDRRLGGKIAFALGSIPAVKGVEIGAGFGLAGLRGSQAHDLFAPSPDRPWARATNRAGGLEGGMTNGEPLVARAVVKPIPTLSNPLPSLDLASVEKVQAGVERSDVCVVPAAGVVGEAMMAFVLAEALLEKFGGDHVEETKNNYHVYVKQMTGKTSQ